MGFEMTGSEGGGGGGGGGGGAPAPKREEKFPEISCSKLRGEAEKIVHVQGLICVQFTHFFILPGSTIPDCTIGDICYTVIYKKYPELAGEAYGTKNKEYRAYILTHGRI